METIKGEISPVGMDCQQAAPKGEKNVHYGEGLLKFQFEGKGAREGTSHISGMATIDQGLLS